MHSDLPNDELHSTPIVQHSDYYQYLITFDILNVNL